MEHSSSPTKNLFPTKQMSANPYPRLVELAERVLVPADLLELNAQTDLSELARVVAENREILNDARHCLTPECCVPLTFEKDFFEKHGPELGRLRSLTVAFCLEAGLAKIDRQLSQVVTIGLDLLRLGNALRRNGLLVDMMSAYSTSLTGLDMLRTVRAEINQEQRAELIKLLPQLEQEIESIGIIVDRDKQWEKATGQEDKSVDFEEKFDAMYDDDSEITEEEKRSMLAAFREKMNLPESERHRSHHNLDRRHLGHYRMLAIDLGLRTFYRAFNHYPNNLDHLAPNILPVVPLDPFTDKPFLYHPSDSTFLLYSPGPNGIDSFVLGPWPMVVAGEANLCLDENDYWQTQRTLHP